MVGGGSFMSTHTPGTMVMSDDKRSKSERSEGRLSRANRAEDSRGMRGPEDFPSWPDLRGVGEADGGKGAGGNSLEMLETILTTLQDDDTHHDAYEIFDDGSDSIDIPIFLPGDVELELIDESVVSPPGPETRARIAQRLEQLREATLAPSVTPPPPPQPARRRLSGLQERPQTRPGRPGEDYLKLHQGKPPVGRTLMDEERRQRALEGPLARPTPSMVRTSSGMPSSRSILNRQGSEEAPVEEAPLQEVGPERLMTALLSLVGQIQDVTGVSLLSVVDGEGHSRGSALVIDGHLCAGVSVSGRLHLEPALRVRFAGAYDALEAHLAGSYALTPSDVGPLQALHDGPLSELDPQARMHMVSHELVRLAGLLAQPEHSLKSEMAQASGVDLVSYSPRALLSALELEAGRDEDDQACLLYEQFRDRCEQSWLLRHDKGARMWALPCGLPARSSVDVESLEGVVEMAAWLRKVELGELAEGGRFVLFSLDHGAWGCMCTPEYTAVLRLPPMLIGMVCGAVSRMNAGGGL